MSVKLGSTSVTCVANLPVAKARSLGTVATIYDTTKMPFVATSEISRRP